MHTSPIRATSAPRRATEARLMSGIVMGHSGSGGRLSARPTRPQVRGAASPRASSRGSPRRSAYSANAGVGPRQRSSSTSRIEGASVRSVARSLKRSASSRRSARTSAGKLLDRAVPVQQPRRVDGADPPDAGIPVRGVADQREIVGNQAPDRPRTCAAPPPRRGSGCSGGPPARRVRRERIARGPCPASRCRPARRARRRRRSRPRRRAHRPLRAPPSATRRPPWRRASLRADGIARRARDRCLSRSCSRARGGCETIR